MTEEKSFDAILKEWATLTYENYLEVVLNLLVGGKNYRRFGLEICELAGVSFSDKIKLITEPVINEAFYTIYEKDYKEYDMMVRFGDKLEQPWAMFVKMEALGITYEEIIKESKRRDNWTQLEEKKKGKW